MLITEPKQCKCSNESRESCRQEPTDVTSFAERKLSTLKQSAHIMTEEFEKIKFEAKQACTKRKESEKSSKTKVMGYQHSEERQDRHDKSCTMKNMER